MVFFLKIASVAAAAACLVNSVVAHGNPTKRELRARDQYADAAARRAQVARDIRAKRNIQTKPKKFRRDLATLEIYDAINHNETGLVDYTIDTAESTVFSANTSCILTPENTDGPYYVTGELIRKNVTEGQPGIPLYLEVQYVDITTCEPVPDIYVDIWNCNSTGYYSGIVANGNDVGWDSTFLRGIQATDSDGVASFETIFPGHYEGRAIHTHLLSHSNVTVLSNGTIQGGGVSHIGQLFWVEELRSAVEATYPYSSNTQAITSNDDDMWSIVQAGTTYDPYPEFLYLGEDITDGLLAWIQIGINVTADQSDSSYYSVAAVLQADGGHASSSSATGGFGGGDFNGTAGGNGTAPPS